MRSLAPFHALPAADRRRLAESYARLLGAAAFPVYGKVPLASSWKPYLEIASCYGSAEEWAQATGYALAPVSGSLLVIIDLDDPATGEWVFQICPALRETFATQRGPDHRHLYCYLADSGLGSAYLSYKRGGQELASIRGVGAYVVGPESDHVDGDQYVPNDQPVITLSLFEQTALLAWFTPPLPQPLPISNRLDGGHAVRLTPTRDQAERDQQAVLKILHARHYRANGEWLNGPCIHPEKHQHNDQHSSFGVNTVTGVGHCFVCGDYSPAEVAAAFNLRTAPPVSPAARRPYAFVADTPRPSLPPVAAISAPDGDQDTASSQVVYIELNITSALIRLKHRAAARLNDLLFDDSVRSHGRHSYRMADLVALGADHGLSRSQVDKGVRALVKLGLLHKREQGWFQRVAVARIREIFGLGEEYARVAVPRAVYRGSVKKYTAAITLVIEQLLPGIPATATIAQAIGVSASSVYRHESALGIVRKTNTKRVGLAAATVHFAKVFDDQQQFVATVNGANLRHQAARLAKEHHGHPWGWQQLPSTRIFPTEAHVTNAPF